MLRTDKVLSFTYPRREIAMVGWCCLDDFTPVDELWVECNGVRLPCLTNLARPDVARAHKTPALQKSGFICRFPEPFELPAKLIGRGRGVEHIVGFLKPGKLPRTEFPEENAGDYAIWLRAHEDRLHLPEASVSGWLGSLRTAPRISVILPTYDTPLYYLQRCIDSVAAQRYPNWELCITDDASRDERVRLYLEERASRDSRIKLALSNRNGGISAASNVSLEASSGEFVVLLDHDDELHPAALLEIVRSLETQGDADLIYSDEDKIDHAGVRSQPAFKPEFDEDLLCGFDYLGHLVAIRTDLVRQVGGFRSETDGAQDWDLLLRVASLIRGDRIRHIAKPLYHWRMHEESTALSLDAKPHAVRAWNTVLKHHFEDQEIREVTDGLFLGSMRVVWRVPETIRVSILYRTCDGSHQRRALERSRMMPRVAFYEMTLTSLRRANRPDSNALLTVEDLQSDVTIVVGCGIDSVNHHFVEELTAQAWRNDCAVVGPTVLNAEGTVITAGLGCLSDGTYVNLFEGLTWNQLGYMGQARVVRAVPALGPQVFAFRTLHLLNVNGLAAIGEDSLGGLCSALVRHAHRSSLKVLHTPYAIATLRNSRAKFHPRQSEIPARSLLINPNLEEFSNLSTIMRTGIH